MRPPIIVDAKSELLLYRTTEDLVADLEGIDVRNGEYPAAYDSEGRRLGLCTKWVKRPILFGLLKVKIEVADLEPLESEPGHAAELSQMIEQHLRTEPSGGRSLRELVQAAVDRLGYTSSSR